MKKAINQTQIVRLFLVAVAAVGVLYALSIPVQTAKSQSLIEYELFEFPNQGKCIQFANSFKNTDLDGDGDVDQDDREIIKDFIQNFCKHR